MAELAQGSNFPAELLRKMKQHETDPQSLNKAGINYAISQCLDLIEHQVAGLHLYTLNKSEATKEIISALP
jgi:methylenetetrahydrofolate reductase (NADPH)